MHSALVESRPAVALLLLIGLGVCLLAGPESRAVAGTDGGNWQTWSAETYTLEPRESFQLRVDYPDIPTRRWRLVVDGGDQNCDLSVLRVQGEELLYYKTNESRHEVSVPWGQGEEIIVVLTNRNRRGSFVVSMLGPPKDQNLASYSYPVNRALEAYAAGQRLKAQDLCREALLADPADGVAKVLLAGFLRESNRYREAEAMVSEALQDELPPDMETLAESLVRELKTLTAPLPQSVRQALSTAERALGQNHPQQALAACDRMLADSRHLSGTARARLLVLRGRALAKQDRNFEAIDAFTQALNSDRAKEPQAVAYFHMGRVFLAMGNLTQAKGAYTIALQNGLPTGLDIQAREKLKLIQDRLVQER